MVGDGDRLLVTKCRDTSCSGGDERPLSGKLLELSFIFLLQCSGWYGYGDARRRVISMLRLYFTDGELNTSGGAETNGDRKELSVDECDCAGLFSTTGGTNGLPNTAGEAIGLSDDTRLSL